MPEQQPDYTPVLLSEFNTRLRDIEERQRLLKDRVLLIGENLVESREEIEKGITELKIQTQGISEDILKIKETLQRLSEELENKARRVELEILRKQFKMFEPLELARLEDVKKMLNEKGKKS